MNSASIPDATYTTRLIQPAEYNPLNTTRLIQRAFDNRIA